MVYMYLQAICLELLTAESIETLHIHINLIPFTQNLKYGTPVPSITISYTV